MNFDKNINTESHNTQMGKQDKQKYNLQKRLQTRLKIIGNSLHLTLM